MELSICSYSFHRLLASGQQDIFKYITDCKELGCTQLDPWNGHFPALTEACQAYKEGRDPQGATLSEAEMAHLDAVKAAADAVGLPFGCIAVDGAHIYEPTPEARAANRAVADKWLAVAERLDARQIRIDAGGPPDMPDEVFEIIVDGYNDLVARAHMRGLQVLMENHWGPSNIPENVVRIMEGVQGLGLLFDSCNWATGMRDLGWELCAQYANATHIKTFAFDEQGNETNSDVPRVMRLLWEQGYRGCWGIESVPKDGDEYAGVRKTIALMRRVFAE